MATDGTENCDPLESCDPCAGIAQSSTCEDEVRITYAGIINDVDLLRARAGSPGDDPLDGAGSITDDELQHIIDTIKSLHLESASRRMADQCITRANTIDSSFAELQDARGMQNSLRSTKLQEIGGKLEGARQAQLSQQEQIEQDLQSKLDAALAEQKSQRQTVLQEIKGSLVKAREQFDVEVATLIENYTQAGLPSDASEYMDEVLVPLKVSPVHNGVSYGVVDEDYILTGLDGSERAVVSIDGESRTFTVDADIFRTISTAFYTVNRVAIKGRYLYLTNNNVDLESAVLWLTTESRIRRYARSVAPTGPLVEELVTRLANYEAEPVTSADGAVADLTRRIDQYQADPFTEADPLVADLEKRIADYEANPVTEADGKVAMLEQAVARLCSEPNLYTADQLVADLVEHHNKMMVTEVLAAVGSSSQITRTQRSDVDTP